MSTSETETVQSRVSPAEFVQLDGVRYEVMQIDTAESHDADGHHNLAARMRRNGVQRGLWLRRNAGAHRQPGKTMFYAVQYASGRYSRADSVGYW